LFISDFVSLTEETGAADDGEEKRVEEVERER